MEATVARHETPLGSWEFAFGSPHATLRPHVARYCGYAERTAAPLRRREPASPYVTLIVSFGAAVEVLQEAAPPRRHVSFVAGPDDAWAVTEHAGEQAGIDVKLTPLAARAVLGVPAGELARQVVDLDAVLGHAGRRLTEQLADAPDWPTRFALLDAFLAARVAEAPPPVPAVARAWHRLESSHGRVRIDGLAAELGCSPRFLRTRFGEAVGLSPKVAARLLRFRRAVTLLGQVGGLGVADIAASCGYADQSHLSRDVRAFAGCPPGDLVGRRLPDGGAFEGDPGAVPKRPRQPRGPEPSLRA